MNKKALESRNFQGLCIELFFGQRGREKVSNKPSSVSKGSPILPPCNLINEVVIKPSIAESISDLSTAFLPVLWMVTFKPWLLSLAERDTEPSVTWMAANVSKWEMIWRICCRSTLKVGDKSWMSVVSSLAGF